MGGLVARYYLRHGSEDIPSNRSIPEVTWVGSKDVENLVMIGTPNAGSIDMLVSLVEGFKPAIFLPDYSPAVLGTILRGFLNTQLKLRCLLQRDQKMAACL